MAAKTGWHRYETKLRHCHHPMYCRRRPRERVDRSDNPAHRLVARTQSHRAEVARAQPALGRRATVPGDEAHRHRSLAVRHLQRVPARHTRTTRDARLQTPARRLRILERSADTTTITIFPAALRTVQTSAF